MRWYAGDEPRGLFAAVSRPAPHLSFSCVKKKDGGEKKKYDQQTRRKRTRRIKGTLSNRDSARAKGAIVRNSAYLPGSVSFSRATSALTRVSILERSPKLYNQVWSPRLRTASPINRARINSHLRLPSTGSPYGLGGLSRRDRQRQSIPPCLLVLLMQRSPWGVGRPTFRCVW